MKLAGGKMINAVHVTTLDKGGAYKAVKRIAGSINDDNINNMVLVRNKNKNGTEIEFNRSVLDTLISKSRNMINMLFTNRMLHNDIMGADISREKWVRNADIIFIHWVSSFVNYKNINKLLKKGKKVVLVLHDMEHFTGGCHYSVGCEEYKGKCINCKYQKNFLNNMSKKYCNKYKNEIWMNYNCHIVAISEWMKDTAEDSRVVFDDTYSTKRKIERIWNPVDTSVFHVRNTEKIRNKLGLDNRQIILFGADRFFDEVKGVKYVFESLRYLDLLDYNILCFGTDSLPSEYKDEFNMIKCLGRIEDENDLAEIYSLADVFVITSIQEAFGYTCCEALACGTPVVAFGVGGLIDQLNNGKCGYLTDVYDCKGIANGIEYCLQNYNILHKNAVEHVNNNFSFEVIGKQYSEYIRNIVSEGNTV